jgi:hypothetical protein
MPPYGILLADSTIDATETVVATSFTALLASNLLAQFSRQIVIQILGLESQKICGTLAFRVHAKH